MCARFLAIHIEPGFERLLRAFGTRAPTVVLPQSDQPRHERAPEQAIRLGAELELRTICIPAAFVTSEP